MHNFLLSIILITFFYKSNVAQEAISLKIGDKAPNLVFPTAKNTEESFSFPYNNRIVLVFFWSSSVSSSEDLLFKYSKIHSKYGNSDFKAGNGFDVISVALQSDRVSWEQDLKKYNLLKLYNCIAQKGYKDIFVKSYQFTQTPYSFLIDEFGKIVYINPDVRTIINYLNGRKNSFYGSVAQNSMAGKVMYSDALKNLKNTKVSILNEKRDTLLKTTTNDVGVFYVKNINLSQNINIVISSNDQIVEEDRVFLANENNEILSILKRSSTGYECNVIDVELPYFKPLNEIETTPVNIPVNPTITETTEYLHKTGGSDLTPASKLKLDALITKLKSSPKSKLEIISHTSCKGDNKLNLALSIKRATIISNYLVLKGIAKIRIKVTGKGETEPLNECIDGFPCTNDELEENNRTVFKISQN